MQTDLEIIIKDRSLPLSSADVKSYMQMVLKGLDFCHKRWVLHRDIKPNNFLVSATGAVFQCCHLLTSAACPPSHDQHCLLCSQMCHCFVYVKTSFNIPNAALPCCSFISLLLLTSACRLLFMHDRRAEVRRLWPGTHFWKSRQEMDKPGPLSVCHWMGFVHTKCNSAVTALGCNVAIGSQDSLLYAMDHSDLSRLHG